jgi:hypothetical protein
MRGSVDAMSGTHNVQIQQALFKDTIVLMEYLSLNSMKINIPPFLKVNEILAGLKAKQHSINTRAAYSRMIYAKEEDKQEAFLTYRKLKYHY